MCKKRTRKLQSVHMEFHPWARWSSPGEERNTQGQSWEAVQLMRGHNLCHQREERLWGWTIARNVKKTSVVSYPAFAMPLLGWGTIVQWLQLEWYQLPNTAYPLNINNYRTVALNLLEDDTHPWQCLPPAWTINECTGITLPTGSHGTRSPSHSFDTWHLDTSPTAFSMWGNGLCMVVCSTGLCREQSLLFSCSPSTLQS